MKLQCILIWHPNGLWWREKVDDSYTDVYWRWESVPSLAIFNGKKKLKFRAPENKKVTLWAKVWRDSELMLRWLKGVILPYAKGRRALIVHVVDSFSAHEKEEFLQVAQSHNIDIVFIPGGCTSKVQPQDVCLNKPCKRMLRKNWLEFIQSLVETEPNRQS